MWALLPPKRRRQGPSDCGHQLERLMCPQEVYCPWGRYIHVISSDVFCLWPLPLAWPLYTMRATESGYEDSSHNTVGVGAALETHGPLFWMAIGISKRRVKQVCGTIVRHVCPLVGDHCQLVSPEVPEQVWSGWSGFTTSWRVP